MIESFQGIFDFGFLVFDEKDVGTLPLGAFIQDGVFGVEGFAEGESVGVVFWWKFLQVFH